ncbi:MAG: lipoyl(octanoyl) transferase LipB [Thermoleophilia bacterium]|nr:lipoyl(octanoyl) transferase LipB [Thermoleophilia bacterium]
MALVGENGSFCASEAAGTSRSGCVGRMAAPREAAWLDLGVEEYTRTYDIQLRLHSLRLTGEILDTFVLVEHPACVTMGKASRPEHVLASPEELSAAGIALYRTDRGGDVTYHGPGQLVLYPIIDLSGYDRDVHAHARRLEQVVIDTAAAFGVAATRKAEHPGVWTAAGKVGAIGLRVKRWVTLHGVSLNVSPDMSHFSYIVPCGIADHGVTSLAQVLERDVDRQEAKSAMREAVARAFDVSLTHGGGVGRP